MNVELLAVGTKAPGWVTAGFEEYLKRLPRDWQLKLREIPVTKRHKGMSDQKSVEKYKEEEGNRIHAALKSNVRVIALDSGGKNWSTEELAWKLQKWRSEYELVQMMIGGPDGLSSKCRSAADDTWSLSKLTFPHFVVRILIAEQIYRAWSILNNHPYHK
ncbi:MAG: 23S rRNA (pseudouridine(1915)-N(3))-methyltransferase RlmH [Gammaproteobacteria bacterium]|nr:23S rRNA (pseudouridine(1915)-N(3))-methyltransferase RlmH [Gammaproteobacteria bacterium]